MRLGTLLLSSVLSLTAAVLAVVACTDDEPVDGTDCPLSDCSDLGYECGEVRDGKGGCRRCGLCTYPETCGGGGVEFMCGCAPRTCTSLGKNCGEILDACSGQTLRCGTCQAPATCGGGGIENVCGSIVGEGMPCDQTNRCGENLSCCGSPPLCVPSSGSCPGPLPDLVVDRRVLRGTIMTSTQTFGPSDCGIQDGCIPGPGTYKLLRFATQTANIGDTDLVLGHPVGNPDFVFMQCHGHYHWNDYITYRLLDRNGVERGNGFKASFCIEDTLRASTDPTVEPEPKYRCALDIPGKGVQGIQRGWADLYTANIDCQWVDITGVPAGDYVLELHVNPERRFLEKSFLNNVVTATVTIR